jgi:hypothetical protein
MSVPTTRWSVQVPYRGQSVGSPVNGQAVRLVRLVSVIIAVVLATAILISSVAGAPQPPGTPPAVAAMQTSIGPEPSIPPGGDPSDPPVTGTVPVETPTLIPSILPTAVPSPPETVPPTETPSIQSPIPSIPASVEPTIPPTDPPVIVAPTDPPANVPPTVPDNPPADQGQGAANSNGPISLTDRFDDPTMRLLGETGQNDSLISGRYEDGAYRLEIDGPEVAPDLIAFVRSPMMANATIHVNARLDGNTDGRYVMATCREVSGYGGYRAYLSPRDGFFAITRFEPGDVPMPLQQGFADELIQGNDAFDFDFSCNGYVLELQVNGETIGIAADNSFAAGTISIGTGFFVDAATGPVTAVFQELEISGNVAIADHAQRPGPARGPDIRNRSAGEPRAIIRRA